MKEKRPHINYVILKSRINYDFLTWVSISRNQVTVMKSRLVRYFTSLQVRCWKRIKRTRKQKSVYSRSARIGLALTPFSMGGKHVPVWLGADFITNDGTSYGNNIKQFMNTATDR